MTAGLRARGLRRVGVVAAAAMISVGLVGCGSSGTDSGAAAGGSGGTVTLEFAQWWEPELPEGAFAKIISQFETENPTIKVKLLSAPYASTKQQLVAGAASKTLPDVVGLDGAW